MNLGFVMCGSFCTFQKALKEMEKLSLIYNIIPVIILSLIAGFIVFIKHKDNIIRLAKGEEKKVFSGK